MLGRALAAGFVDNTPHGYNWTFIFPMLLFVVVAAALYVRFRTPHKVPGHVQATQSKPAAGASQATAATAHSAGPATVGRGPDDGGSAPVAEQEEADRGDEAGAE